MAGYSFWRHCRTRSGSCCTAIPSALDRSSSAYPLGPEFSVLPNRQHDTAPTRCKYNAGYNPASQSPLPDSRLPALVPLHESGSLPVSCGPGHAHRDASYPILTQCLLTYERLDTGSRVIPFLGAIDSALLLRFAHEDNTFVLSKSGPALVGDIVFALTFLEGDHRDIVVSDVAFNRFNKTAGDRLNHLRRGYRMSAVDADELENPLHRLQNGHVDVEVHPVNPLKFEHHMVAQYLRHALWVSRSQPLCRFATHGSVINQNSLESHTSHARRSEAKPR